MMITQESTESATSGEIKEPQPLGCSLIAEMVTTSSGTEPHLDNECEAVQNKGTDNEVSIIAAEQEPVSGPVVILSDVTQENAESDGLQSTQLALESAGIHRINTALIEVPPEVKQVNVTPMETEEHSTDIKNEPQDQPDLSGPVIKLFGDSDEVENGTKTTSSPGLQTSSKERHSANPFHERSLDVNGIGVLFQKMEEKRLDPKAQDDHPERLTATILEHLEEACCSSEIPLQAAEETETLEPPAKKRLRRRMGMCGLGDRKKRLPFDGQYCRQGLVGRQREEGALKGNKGVQDLHNTGLENDGTTVMGHEGTAESAYKDHEEVLKDKGNNGAAVMDNEGTSGEAKIENIYALRNNRCTPLLNDERTTDESPKENRDIPKNDGNINMDDKGTSEPVVLEYELNLLEEISAWVEQTLFSPTTAKNSSMIQGEPAIATATEMETAICVDEPNFPGTEVTNGGRDIDLLVHVDNNAGENNDEIATEVEVVQEVICCSSCNTVEMPEGSFIVTKAVEEIPAGLEEREIQIEEQCPPNMAATDKPDPNGPELNGSAEKQKDSLFVDNMDITAIDFIDIRNEEGHGEQDKPITAVSESTEPAGGDTKAKEIILEPPTSLQNHMQQVCNPTLNPAANELPQETDVSVYSVTDSQLHTVALSMELEDQPVPEGYDQQEDATELVRGLIRELSSLNRTAMAAHREMELLRRSKLPKAPNRRPCAPRRTEI